MTFIVDVMDMLPCQQFLIGYCKIPLQKEVSVKRLIGVPPSYANGGAAPESATACRWRGGALLCVVLLLEGGGGLPNLRSL
jgi:hypothetical protein